MNGLLARVMNMLRIPLLVATIALVSVPATSATPAFLVGAVDATADSGGLELPESDLSSLMAAQTEAAFGLPELLPSTNTALDELPSISIPATTSTRCAMVGVQLTLVVCANAIAIASVICTHVSLAVQCTGAGTVGGGGYSAIGLPGDASWNGISQCTSCASPVSGSRVGSASWPAGDLDGQNTQSTVNHGTVQKTFGCISGYTVRADSSATAFVLAGAHLIQASSTATHAMSGNICN